jgi:hypothetical protein
MGIRTHDTEFGDFGLSGDYLLRNDWLSCLIGALLWRLGTAEAGFGILPCREFAPGGAEVVRRMASREPQRIP